VPSLTYRKILKPIARNAAILPGKSNHQKSFAEFVLVSARNSSTDAEFRHGVTETHEVTGDREKTPERCGFAAMLGKAG